MHPNRGRLLDERFLEAFNLRLAALVALAGPGLPHKLTAKAPDELMLLAAESRHTPKRSPFSSEPVLQSQDVERLIGHHLRSGAILRLELAQAIRLVHLQPTALRSPLVDRGGPHSVLSGQLGDSGPALDLLSGARRSDCR